MDSSSSSKVTVEYHDPSGIFPLISRDLASRLPLRNLNWKSPTRPLRSIGALHVEFVPDAATAQATDASLQRVDSYGAQNALQQTTAADSAGKERRHQIPGLRKTPYLKLYILRCDDKETYKTSSVKHLRDWVRENSPPSRSTSDLRKPEQHDAFEWLILHVTLPDTVAAGEPRWTIASKKDPDDLIERPSSTTKWPGKSTRTVLDKIRADFNPTSKSAPDRVAQLRLQKNAVPPQYLPREPVASPYSESPQEQENAWQDLISKFKTLILMSFDARVAQYEEDIREKDAQRTLPGWNFCTFFALKEGLARGFESVGLVEDAFAIYDELSAGLDAAIRDSSDATLADNRSSIRERLDQTLQDSPDSGSLTDLGNLLHKPLNRDELDYREAIVSSKISLFDFQTYIFSRQKALLLRLGNIDKWRKVADVSEFVQKSASAAGAGPSDDDLAFIAESCDRSTEFIAANARLLRHELTAGSIKHSLSLTERISSSWMYSVAEQVLEETISPNLPTASQSLQPQSQQPLQPGAGARRSGNFNFPQGANQYPNRSSSLLTGTPIYENEQYASPQLPTGNATTNNAERSGSSELAASRAELYLMQRRVLETMGKAKGWSVGWAAFADGKAMEDVDLSGDEQEADKESTASPDSKDDTITDAVLHPHLMSALTSQESFRAAYERLSDLAARNFVAGNRAKAADTVFGDIAMLKFQAGDYANAAAYFQRALPQQAQAKWSVIQAEMLKAYAKCLKHLNRKDEFIRTTLSLVSKVVAGRKERKLPLMRASTSNEHMGWLNDELIDVKNCLPELVEYSAELPYNFTAPLTQYFGDVEVSREVCHHADKDGFSLELRFRHLLDDAIQLDRVKLRLVHDSDPNQEIWLESAGEVELKQGLMKLAVHSNVSTFGHYLIDKVSLEAKKLHFMQEYQPKTQHTPLTIASATSTERKPTARGPSILLYPGSEAFDAQASLFPNIHIDQQRSSLVKLYAGWNDIEHLDLRLKPASAGLRLHTGDATLLAGDDISLDTATAGTLKFGKVPPRTNLQLQIPYSLEHDLREVTIRLEAHYHTSHGESTAISTATIPVELVLDVDVHDVFKADKLFSRFSIRTTNSTPLLITNVELKESDAFALNSMLAPEQMVVYEKQPANLTYQFTPKQLPAGRALDKKQAALSLMVTYHEIDAVVLDKITAAFAASMEQSLHAPYRRLLLPILTERARILAVMTRLEHAVLLDEVTVPSYNELSWSGVVAMLPSTIREPLTQWLQQWHKAHTTLPLNLSTTSTARTSRHITLSVPIPTLDILHTATLTLPSTPRASLHLPPHATVGEPLTAVLRIRHTRRWSAARLYPSSASTSSPSSDSAREKEKERQEKLDFTYELIPASSSTPETWLISGPSRAHFSAAEGEEKTFTVALVPLRRGCHLLPQVEIRVASPRRGGDGRNGDDGEVSCETDYLSAGETVLVTAEARTTTVTVREEGMGVGAMGARASLESRVSRAVV